MPARSVCLDPIKHLRTPSAELRIGWLGGPTRAALRSKLAAIAFWLSKAILKAQTAKHWNEPYGNDPVRVRIAASELAVILSRRMASESQIERAAKSTVAPLSKTSSAMTSNSSSQTSRLRELTVELRELEAKLRLGGGLEKIEKQHKQRKLTARERIDLLLDRDSFRQEIGLLVAYDQYKKAEGSRQEADGRPQEQEAGSKKEDEVGTAPAAGVVTTIGCVGGREVVVVANDATVKAGSWWPETIKKILRAQEIAMRSHVPIIYLVDSAGVNLP